ncbi:hypothetical protein PIB30_051616 [Stylosanthes scabra]|uniref:Uncharacterized protein n=1 Tax=Stylosanthes scabra TaxID=79078 RepID=A0ABU6SIZ3_9FABA|nr:hypothetical protein [Stylosanthes scabra]
MYTNLGLQRGIPGLTLFPAEDIATRIKNNVKANKRMFDGMTHPWSIGESSKEKTPIEKDVARDPTQIQMMSKESGEKKQRNWKNLKRKKPGRNKAHLGVT